MLFTGVVETFIRLPCMLVYTSLFMTDLLVEDKNSFCIVDILIKECIFLTLGHTFVMTVFLVSQVLH